MGNTDYTTTSTEGTFYVTYCDNCTATTSSGWVYCYQPKRYLVKNPVRWKQKGKDAFIKLVNDETSTGWKVTMVIDGKVEILDPNIEVITAKKFAAIMRWSASQEDKEKIDVFAKAWL